MSDEIASATLSTSQKAIEVALELIKLLAPLAQKFLSEVYHKSVDGIYGKLKDNDSKTWDNFMCRSNFMTIDRSIFDVFRRNL